jgi:hypothetical protein
VNAKKKKGKAAACNDCKAAGGDCVRLSAAGFILSGIPDDHEKTYYNGPYSKTEQIVNSRHVYSGPNEMGFWFCNRGWQVGFKNITGTKLFGGLVKSLAPSPASISNDSAWKVVEPQETGLVHVSMRGITTAALNAKCQSSSCCHTRC